MLKISVAKGKFDFIPYFKYVFINMNGKKKTGTKTQEQLIKQSTSVKQYIVTHSTLLPYLCLNTEA